MPRPRSTFAGSVAILALAAVAAVAGCSSPAPTPTTPGPTASTSSSPSASVPTPSSPSATAASSEPTGGPFGTSDVSSPGIPELRAGGVGSAVRVGRHRGFDRVVYEFTGPEPPRFTVGYVESAIADPSGEPVPVSGDAILQVLAFGVYYPEHGEPAPAPVPASALRGTVFAQVKGLYGGFEGIGQEFVGINGGKRPFRVFTLTGPSRIVIDVQSTS